MLKSEISLSNQARTNISRICIEDRNNEDQSRSDELVICENEQRHGIRRLSKVLSAT